MLKKGPTCPATMGRADETAINRKLAPAIISPMVIATMVRLPHSHLIAHIRGSGE
jgi:hypothetical protein